MTILLDTHALLWFLADDPRLGSAARETIETGRIILSDVSLLEISIKVSTGKLVVDSTLHGIVRELGFERSGIEERFLSTLERLPLLHRDPFDRFLIAQALADNLHVLTADQSFARYGAQVIDALT